MYKLFPKLYWKSQKGVFVKMLIFISSIYILESQLFDDHSYQKTTLILYHLMIYLKHKIFVCISSQSIV